MVGVLDSENKDNKTIILKKRMAFKEEF